MLGYSPADICVMQALRRWQPFEVDSISVYFQIPWQRGFRSIEPAKLIDETAGGADRQLLI
jgi:hypothetical protein